MNNTQKILIGALVVGTVALSLLGGCGLGASTWGAGMMGGGGGTMGGWGGMGMGMWFFGVLFVVGLPGRVRGTHEKTLRDGINGLIQQGTRVSRLS